MTDDDPRVEDLRRVSPPKYPSSHTGSYGSPSRSGGMHGPMLFAASVVLGLIVLWVLIEVLR